jgi:arylsulfatase A-like enzyme
VIDASERAALKANAEKYLFHPDLSATMLDLMGVWDAPQIAPHRASLAGQSLLRPLAEPRTLPMTNCASLWTCAFENWGGMQGQLKLFGRTPFDQGWQCFDVVSDAKEEHSLHSAECQGLQDQVLRWFTRPPL